MTYRMAVRDDLDSLVAMFRQFVASTQYRRYVGDSAEAVTGFLGSLIVNPCAAIFVAEDAGVVVGMLGVLAYVQPMSGESVAGELFWWLNPEKRGAGGWLLRRAEKWAKAQGAKKMTMVQPADNPRVGEMYQGFGYQQVEVMHQKELV